MLNNNKGGSNNREANSFNSYNSLNDFDLRFINNVEQLDDVLARFSRQPVSLYINRGLMKLGEQAIRLLYFEGGPWKSLSEFVEAAIYDLIKRRVLKQSGLPKCLRLRKLMKLPNTLRSLSIRLASKLRLLIKGRLWTQNATFAEIKPIKRLFSSQMGKDTWFV